jgi:hypothetical protein
MKPKIISIILCVIFFINILEGIGPDTKEQDPIQEQSIEESQKQPVKGNYDYTIEDSKIKVDFDDRSVGDGIKVSAGDYWAVWKWKEMGFVDDKGGSETISPVADVEGLKKDNTITYRNTYPFTIESFTVSENRLKHDIILSQFQFLSYDLANIKYLGYIGTLEFSDDLSIYVDGEKKEGDFITSSSIGFIDENGIEQFFIPPPYAYEKNNEKERIDCHYEIKHVNEEVLFYISTSYKWLSDVNRNFPVVIDPTFSTLYDPVADAGPDQIGYVNEPVYLDGSASHDVDGDIVSYDWEILMGFIQSLSQ